MRPSGLWLVTALLLAASPAGAAPLEPAECKSLKTDYEALLAAGAKQDMAKGPDWAKNNLEPDRLEQIARLITVEEQLSFRCGQMVTAAPQMKEPPPASADGRPRGKGQSRIPLPIKKSAALAGTKAKN